MASVFTKIIRGEIPSYRVYEDENHLAFLDVNPVQKGHTLVVPKEEVDYVFELDGDRTADLFRVVRRVARALKAATGCMRVVMVVVGYEVPHAHVHLIPTNVLADFPLRAHGKLDASEAEALAGDIRHAVAAGG